MATSQRMQDADALTNNLKCVNNMITPEEKQLLLKDLCTREPYHPRIQVFNQGYEGFQDGEFDTNL